MTDNDNWREKEQMTQIKLRFHTVSWAEKENKIKNTSSSACSDTVIVNISFEKNPQSDFIF